MEAKLDELKLGRRARTRVALVAAATELIGEKGFEALSMEAVAEGAGVSRRTLYDNFPSRNALISAVVMERRAPLLPPVEPGSTLRQHLRTVAKTVVEMSNNPAHGRMTAAFELYVLSDEDMQRQVLETNRRIYPFIEKSLVEHFGRNAFGMSPRRFVRVLHAVIDGLLLRRRMMPEEFTREVVCAALDALAPPDCGD